MNPSGISSSSMKYLRLLQQAVDFDPFVTRDIPSTSKSRELCWDVQDVREDFSQIEFEANFVESSNFENSQPIESLMVNSFEMNESEIPANIERPYDEDSELPNASQINFETDNSMSCTELFKSPFPKRQRRCEPFATIGNEFYPETTEINSSDFLQSWRFTETVDTPFEESSVTMSKVLSQKMEEETLEITNLSINQVGEFAAIADDDIEMENDEDNLIDSTMLPESYKGGLLEKTLMQKESLAVNTAYKTRSLMKTSRHVIDSFFKVQKVGDWKAVAADMMKMMEPNFDYLQAKLFPEMKVEVGEENFNVNLIEEINSDEIEEPLEEIEKSFSEINRSIVSSTPNRSSVRNQSVCDESEVRRESNQVKSEDITLSETSMNVQDLKPFTEPNEANLTEASAVDHQNLSANNFHFSMCDPDDFMFSRNVFPDSTAAPDESAVEPNFRGFAQEDQEEDQEILQSLEYYRITHLTEILPQIVTLADKRREAIISQLGNIFVSLLQSLVQQKPMTLKIRTIRNWRDCEISNEILSQNETKITTKSINFSNKASERTFTITLTIMSEIYKMLRRNLTCAKRELYYRDVELYRTQESVNRAVDTVCTMLNVQEFELGIVSTSKGLIAGNLIINIGEERIDCSTTRAVPSNPSAITSFESDAEFVLVVEKDTVFQRLVGDIANIKQIKTNIILVTAKGYPDVNTRVLLKKMSLLLDKPIYILVDADPHGIEIMCTYKYGSLMKVHNSEHLAVPSIKWIGIHPSDIESLDVTRVELTDADMKKVHELLQRPYMNPFLKTQLQCLQHRRIKAEIESIYHYSIDYLINEYIPRKIRSIEMPPIP